MSLVQRYIGEDFMARHEFKIFSPNGPGREPRLRPEASAWRESPARRGAPAGGSPGPAGAQAWRGAPRGRAPRATRSAGTGVRTMIVSSFGRYMSQSAHDHEAPAG